MLKRVAVLLFLLLTTAIFTAGGTHILVYMDNTQTNHLRAYGAVYYALSRGMKGKWLLNYRGGSFLLPSVGLVKNKLTLLNVSFSEIDEEDLARINKKIETGNMHSVDIEKAPKIAVYSPPQRGPWDDAVTLVLTYAQIPYTLLWDKEVLRGDLTQYDWLHLHHEDFTGQYGKFYAAFRHVPWYIQQVNAFTKSANEAGFRSVSEHKRAVAQKIQSFVKDGGFLFAMCSATDTIDIALASHGLDIVPAEIDGTPISPNAQERLDFNATFAFTNFKLIFDPNIYEFSDIDVDIHNEGIAFMPDSFSLFEFSAKIDTIPTILNQNHVNTVKGFLGQTTAFNKDKIKDKVTILGMTPGTKRVKYLNGFYGKGQFTFYGGHDPECYRHLVGAEPTNLAMFPNSPGYRLILNNILFPSARKKRLKT